MSGAAETLKTEIKKLSARATGLKMELHDLSEELPAKWREIPEVAARTHRAYEELEKARQRLAEMAGE